LKILLDTCAFIWVVSGSELLSVAARDAFVSPANDVYLSAASVWEVSVKWRLGRLPLPEAPDRLIPRLRADHGILPLPIAEEACLQELRLPDLHRDPFDRMLVCQAIAEGMVLLTPDELIRQYPVRSLW
jgi:PIN domain nuclease of toxin-antitoxin system